MKKWIATCGIAAGLFFAVTARAADWPSGTVIARIIGPCQGTAETSLQGTNAESALFWTTIEVKETRRYFDTELVGKKIRILTTPFSDRLLGETIPLQIIRTTINTPEPLGLATYRFQCGKLASAKNMGTCDEATPHGIVLAKIIGPVPWISTRASKPVTNSVPSEWIDIEVLEARDGFAEELKGRTTRVRTWFVKEELELVGKTIPIELCRHTTTNLPTEYFLQSGLKYSHELATFVEEQSRMRQKEELAKPK